MEFLMGVITGGVLAVWFSNRDDNNGRRRNGTEIKKITQEAESLQYWGMKIQFSD